MRHSAKGRKLLQLAIVGIEGFQVHCRAQLARHDGAQHLAASVPATWVYPGCVCPLDCMPGASQAKARKTIVQTIEMAQNLLFLC